MARVSTTFWLPTMAPVFDYVLKGKEAFSESERRSIKEGLMKLGRKSIDNDSTTKPIQLSKFIIQFSQPKTRQDVVKSLMSKDE